jgi:hypothetical protein
MGSKLTAVLKTLMARKANGCGKIVFCHYYAEIDALQERLHQADPTLRIAKFDGRVPNSKRGDILSEPVDILLAQIKMCREGLNLQDNYSEVYFPSPHFNPATEQQSIARCWRIGQQKEVHVFRYIMGGNPPGPPSGEDLPEELGGQVEPPLTLGEDLPASGVQGGSPLTMDMFSTQLHIKKREFVARMADAASATKKLKIKYKVKYKVNYKVKYNVK